MKILLSSQIKEADAYTIKYEPIASVDLMERAAKGCFDWMVAKFRNVANRKFYIFVGQGNNGGDGLVIARMLAGAGAEVLVYTLSENFSNDAKINLQRLHNQAKATVNQLHSIESFPELDSENIIIDALFGTGLSRPLDGFAAEVVSFINSQNCMVISIDIPSGLFGEDNSVYFDNQKDRTDLAIVKANYTLTFQMPFLSFLFAETYPYIGDWHTIPIGLHENYLDSAPSEYFLTGKAEIAKHIAKRQKFAHKGNFGHALLIAGSFGKMGAAVLAANACLRTGVGLLTVHAPKSGYTILQTAVPEAMVNADKNKKVVANLPSLKNYSAIGIGSGLDTKKESLELIEKLFAKCNKPLVIDADALNLLAANKDLLKKIPKGSILTPHPKEFERLAGNAGSNYQQNRILMQFAQTYGVVVVLKGAYTSVAQANGVCSFNTSGNAGMATAGSGDALTGVILSLLAQGMTPEDAAKTGVFVHGLAGDIAAQKRGQHSMIAGDIVDNLSDALQQIIV